MHLSCASARIADHTHQGSDNAGPDRDRTAAFAMQVADSQPRATASQEVHERSDQVNMTLSQQRMRRSTHIVSENY